MGKKPVKHSAKAAAATGAAAKGKVSDPVCGQEDGAADEAAITPFSRTWLSIVDSSGLTEAKQAELGAHCCIISGCGRRPHKDCLYCCKHCWLSCRAGAAYMSTGGVALCNVLFCNAGASLLVGNVTVVAADMSPYDIHPPFPILLLLLW